MRPCILVRRLLVRQRPVNTSTGEQSLLLLPLMRRRTERARRESLRRRWLIFAYRWRSSELSCFVQRCRSVTSVRREERQLRASAVDASVRVRCSDRTQPARSTTSSELGQRAARGSDRAQFCESVFAFQIRIPIKLLPIHDQAGLTCRQLRAHALLIMKSESVLIMSVVYIDLFNS